MTERYAHVLSFALSHPWAIDPQMVPVIAGILARHMAGADSSAEIAAALVNRANLPQPKAGSVAVIQVYGVVAPRMNLMSEMSGGTTYEKLTGSLREAMGNKAVKTVVLDINSPGGSVAGATEFARELLRSRAKKPVVAQIQYTGASAAYWIASAATEIIAAPSATVGSIGVYAMHEDVSKALEGLGVKRTYVSAGKGKVDGNDAEPLSEQALARMTTAVEDAYASFVGDVVKGRGAGMTAERVKKDWKALTYSAADAKALGMIDGIATLDDTLARILSASPDESDRRAALDFSPTDDTAQEPDTVTAQDRLADAHWQSQVELALLDL